METTAGKGWRIELLGGLRAVADGRTIHHFRTHRAGLLLAYLALHPGKPCSREALGEMLWPGEEPGVQRTRLRYELTVLRAVFGDELFVRSGNFALTFPDEKATDVAVFESLLREALALTEAHERLPLLRRALDLYKDDLLPGISPPESEYDGPDWLETHRLRLRELYFDAGRRFLLDLEATEDAETAEHWRKRLTMRFPDRLLPAPRRAPTPSPETSGSLLFGRAHEMAHVLTWWERETAPPLTLIGLGGIGKTYLARHALEQMNGVFVPIGDITSVEELYLAIHAALGLPPGGPRPLRRQVRDELRLRDRFVLLLDGAEQGARAIGTFLSEILASCPRLRLLITSRRALRLLDEEVVRIGPLSAEEGEALFLHRARAVRSTFAITERGMRTARDVARLLAGMPLALELAAARALVLGPEQIREQLSQQFQFLVTANPSRAERHRSLLAVLEWSYRALAPASRLLLARLSVFRSSFRLDGVTAMCGENGAPPLDALEELRMHALLEARFDPVDEQSEFHLLRPIADFTARFLTTDEDAWVRVRHRTYFERESDALGELVRGDGLPEGARRLRTSLPDYRAAAQHAIATAARDTLLRLLYNLGFAYAEMGLREEFVRLFEAVETLPPGFPIDERTVLILGWRAALARRQGDNRTAWRYWQARLRMQENLRDHVGMGQTLIEMTGQAIDEENLPRATDCFERARILGDTFAVPPIIENVIAARLAVLRADRDDARTRIAAGRSRLSIDSPGVQNRLYACTYLAQVAFRIEDLSVAEELIREGLDLSRGPERRFNRGVLLRDLGRLRERQGRYSEASIAFTLAAAIHEDLESRYAEECRRERDRFPIDHPPTPEMERLLRDLSALPETEAIDRYLMPPLPNE
ncbi:MAG: hypothetical protein SFU56_15715 [Capsulimonadales bacterium]|nr:hypothetical protein [Capsulimonadales bacterium]